MTNYERFVKTLDWEQPDRILTLASPERIRGAALRKA
jgi:hypothetical protein